MGYKNLRPGEIAEKSNTNNYTPVQDGPKLERKKKILSLIYFANALAHEDESAEEKCRRLASELFAPLNQRDAAQAEADQLRAQVAALEAEVARLREPVALVWANHNDEKKSQEIDGHWYEVRISLWGGFYPVFCDALSTQTVNGVLNAGAESLAIAACAAHHAARYREMQGPR